MLKKLLFISVFAITCATANGQTPYFKQYTVREGLPSNYVYYVFQDSKGYIWLCTDVGVSRFDGARFTNFTTADGLTDNEVFTCTEDRQGRIWFATLNGKPCFFQHEKMHSESDIPLLRGFDLDGLINHIFQEETGEVVMSSPWFLGKLDLDKNTSEQFEVPYGTLQIWDEPGSNIGILTNTYLGYLDGAKFTQTATLDGLKLPIKHVQSGDSLFMVFGQKLVIVSLEQHRILSEKALPKSITEAISITVHPDQIWIGDRKGLHLFDRKTMEELHVFLPKSQVSASIKDREGGWWFSTLTEGIFYVPAPENLQYGMPNGETSLRINCLSPDASGRLWLGMNESTYGILDNNNLRTYRQYPPGIKPRGINNIKHLPDGSTLLAGKAGILHIRGGKPDFYRLRASDAALDAEGNLWSVINGAFFIPSEKMLEYRLDFNVTKEEVEPEYYVKHPPTRLSDIRADRIVFDHSNTAWLASPNGLYFRKNGKISPAVLPHATRDLLFDEKTQTLWALTEANGLFAFRNGQVLDSIRIGRGQTNAISRGLCADEAGDHWVATASGLFKVEGTPGRLRLMDFTSAYGMSAEKLNAVAVLNGQVFMGKDDGLMSAPVTIFTKKLPPPPIYLKKLLVNGKEKNLDDQPLSLVFGENSLVFSFEGLSFKDFKNLHYRYRLQGHETDWHTTANEAVEYASLSPGHYRFEVTAVNSSGVESTSAAVLAFSIAKPFWMEWWFVLAALSGLAGLIFVWVKKRERKLRHQYEIQQRMMATENEKLELQRKNADLKMLALRLQMNPHFIFNALNTIKGYYGQEKFTQANSYIAKFARLLRLNLDYSDAYIPLDQEVELLKIYMQLSQIRYPDKMEFKVEIAPGIVPSAVLIPSMVIQPFVENAVIHGIVGKEGLGLVSLHFTKLNGEIIATIRDNGIGRKASAAKSKLRDPHKPLATAITQERLELLRKKSSPPALEINDLIGENGRSAGTEVLLRLPFEIL